MQREHTRRGFSLYKVVLEIDFSGSLWGYTEITIVPTSKDLKTLHLHSRQCTIHSVTVANHRADFIHYDPLTNLSVSDPKDLHTHPELRRKVYSALADGDEGELSIAIPKEVSLKQSGSTTGVVVSEAATPEPQTPGFAVAHTPVAIPEFSPITVNIEYSLRHPVDGLQFIVPSDAYPYRAPHVFTTPSSPDAARCWVPCIDNIWERCTWELEFVVPRHLEDRDENPRADDGEEAADSHPTVVVCSGEFIEQVAHPYNSNKSIFLFSQSILTSVQHIGFVAGPLHVFPIPADHASDDVNGSSQPLMHAFCLPGHEAQLAASVSFIRQAMTFYTTELGSYPFGSHKIVFVDELPTIRFDTSTLSIVTVDLLHGEDAIDQVFETREALSHALACQWSGINIQPKTWSDLWLVDGIGLYIAGLFLRKLFGNNEYRFRLKKDMERIFEQDDGSMLPICQPQCLDPPDAGRLPFVHLKSPLVLHILDRRLGKSGTALGLSRVLPKLFLSAISGEMPNNALSTHNFLRTCRKVSGVDLRSFAEQWIYGSGCPSFGFSASFNRKKMAVEITMRQEAPAWKFHEHDEVTKALYKPVPFFEGQMTIRIHEADGTPYEHVLDIRAPFKRYEVPFNTKYKRVRRNTKRYLARQAAAQAAAEGDQEAAEAMGMVDMGFGLEIWEKEKERENWKVVDWTEEDEQLMSGATYEWIRMDADFEWIAMIAFDQPDYMWVSQLQRDRDVVAQLEAINALTKMPTPVISSTLTKTVLVTNYFYRIRCEAALTLVTCALPKLEFLGLFHLFKLFLRYCYDPEDPQQDLFTHTYVPRPNDFSDIAEYFVRRTLIKAIAQVRFGNGKCPSVVRQFLIDQLKYNDNTANPYTDAFYICTIISSLACASVSTAPPERGELFPMETKTEQTSEDANLLQQALSEADRYRNMDRLIASPHNIVTIAALEFRLILSMANLIPNDPRIFFPLTREGNYTQVRIAAFDALFLTKWFNPKITRYLLAVVANDPSRIIRRHVARNAFQSLALLVSMGELKGGPKESESLLIEEDGTLHEKVKENKKSEIDVLIKALRKDKEVGKNEVIRECLLPIALAPDVDFEVRWMMLKLADIVVKGHEEAPPKLSIHLPPPTPVIEVLPPLPPVKVLPVRPLKTGGPPARSPLLPTPVPSKIRLLPSGGSTESHLLNHRPSDGALPSVVGVKKGVVFQQPLPKGKGKQKSNTKSVPKAQSSGMGVMDIKACRNALGKVKANKHAHWFLQPVDPVRDEAPRYFEIIKNPMDLGTMSAKLEQGMYRDRFAFESDFRLIIRNAKTYNSPDTYVFNEAVAIESFFEKLWIRINKTIDSKAVAGTKPVMPMAPPPLPSSVASIAGPSKPRPIVPASNVPSSSEAAPRPSIKLKLGGGGPPDILQKSTPVAKPKPRKLKPTGNQRPPPVDDGSIDLLEEVIAIEREKEKKKAHQRHSVESSERQDSSSSTMPMKRKKLHTPEESTEDEILELASPSKKLSRPSPPEKERAKKPMLKQPGSVKIGKSSSAESSTQIQSPPLPPAIENPRIAIKLGDDRTPTPTFSKPTPTSSKPAPTPKYTPPSKPIPTVSKPTPNSSRSATASSKPPKKSPVVQAMPINKTKCKEVLKTLLKLPEAGIFARPVDPQLDGCPTYYDEIKDPMDFGTIGQRLNTTIYTTMEDFTKDIELVFSNCRLFNPPTTYPTDCADAVERLFKKEWAKIMEKKLPWTEKRSLQSLMTNLVKESISFVFREPVDPKILGIPQYFEIIPKKDARDLRTIRQKLDTDKYDSIEAWEADMELMIRNAIHFNGADSDVGQVAVLVRNRVRDMLSGVKSQQGVKKRKEGDKPNGGPVTKKAKLG